MNESSSSKQAPSSSSSSTEQPSSANAAAQAILARRSNDQIPLSLGKASLRMRLEAYYSLISPETLSNRTVWLRKYDQIYEKYGGTHQGEEKLARKLAKKYGTAVRLLVVNPTEEKAAPSSSSQGTSEGPVKQQRDESWYRLRPEETASGVVDFLSSEFDPWAALVRASKDQVLAANPWMTETPTAASSSSPPSRSVVLDNLGKCASLLPADDPLRRDGHHKRQFLKTAAASASKHPGLAVAPQDASSKESKKRPRNHPTINAHNLHPFDAIASHLDAGPHSLLFRCKQERTRVKIVVRYVNMVRGTLSGTLVAFDKHMNMILRDVEEVYSPRLVNNNDEEEEHQRQSNLELELERRRRVSLGSQPSCNGPRKPKASSSQPLDAEPQDPFADPAHQQQHGPPPGTWNVRRRQMKQLLVRGDMVVSIYVADQENRAVTTSRYSKPKAQP